MVATVQLPIPHVTARRFGARCLPALTDDALFAATGVRMAFTGREGGVSEGAYATLNLGDHVQDDLGAVMRNRELVLEALGGVDVELVVPKQVHGNEVVELACKDSHAVEVARERARAGADALVVGVPNVAALLCFADCVPVAIVSPTGRFALAHAGWRGVVNDVAVKAARRLAVADAPDLGSDAMSFYNVYIGPHICASCFETGADVRDLFIDRFGALCAPDERHVDLGAALTCALARAGIACERVCDVGACTRCENDRYFSYRAENGVCGRHGAVAFRKA